RPTMTIVQFLKPSALGLLLMILWVSIQTTGYRVTWTGLSTSLESSDMSVDTRFGLPAVMRIYTRGPTERRQRIMFVEVYWKNVTKVLVTAWLVTMPVGRWISGYRLPNGQFVGPLHTGWRSP